MKICCTEQEKQSIIDHCCIKLFDKENKECKRDYFNDNRKICEKCFAENEIELIVSEEN